jgi:hypothetical protein
LDWGDKKKCRRPLKRTLRGRSVGPGEVDVGVAVENVGRLVDAIGAGESGGGLRVMESEDRRRDGFAEAEDALVGAVGGGEGSKGELEAVEADDGAAVAFDDGGDAVPVGAAKVATDNEAAIFDALHR